MAALTFTVFLTSEWENVSLANPAVHADSRSAVQIEWCVAATLAEADTIVLGHRLAPSQLLFWQSSVVGQELYMRTSLEEAELDPSPQVVVTLYP